MVVTTEEATMNMMQLKYVPAGAREEGGEGEKKKKETISFAIQSL